MKAAHWQCSCCGASNYYPENWRCFRCREAVEKAYAVTAATRCAGAPDIPTVDEGGLPGVHILAWYALFAPKATPKPIIARLNGAMVDALSSIITGRWRLALEIPGHVLYQDDPPGLR
jgi:hypothetical protein